MIIPHAHLSDEENFGMLHMDGTTDCSVEDYTRFIFDNTLQTFGKNLFNTAGITQAVKTLVVASRIHDPQIVVSKYTNLPPPWRPSNNAIKSININYLLERDVTVYFNELRFETNFEKKKWLDVFQKFSNVINTKNVEYWYGPSGSEYPSRVVLEGKPPYQAFCRLFDNTISAFSCFVGPTIMIDGWTNRGTDNFEKYGHTNFGKWRGSLKTFLDTTQNIESAIESMDCSNQTIHGDIKLMIPEYGLIVMRPKKTEHVVQLESFSDRSFVEPNQIILPQTIIMNNNSYKQAMDYFRDNSLRFMHKAV